MNFSWSGVYRCLVLLVICLSIPHLSVGSETSYADLRFNHIRTQNGLSNSTVSSVTEDSNGFIWFATYDGLNRYDGHKCVTYRHIEDDTTSLCSSRVNALVTDAQGRLWIGTAAGLNLYDYQLDRFYRFRHTTDNDKSLLSNAITYLFYDSIQNYLWISADPDGLCRLDLDDLDLSKNTSDTQFVRYDYHQINGVTALLIDDNNQTILLGRAASMYLYDRATDTFKSMPMLDRYEASLDRKAKRIHKDNNGHWWLTCGGKLHVYKRIQEAGSIRLHEVLTRDCFSEAMMLDMNGNMWVGHDFIDVYDTNTLSLIKRYGASQNAMSLSNSEIQCIYQDKQAIVWIGTRDDGVNKCLFKANFFTHLYEKNSTTSGLSGNVVTSIMNSNKAQIWFSVYDGGITIWDEQTEEFTHITTSTNPGITNNKVLDVYEDSNGVVWAGTWTGGLFSVQRKGADYVCTNVNFKVADTYGLDCFWRIAEDRSGRLWLASQEVGVVLFDKSSNTCIKFPHDINDISSIRGNMVISLLVDSKNRLFAGTYLGLDMVDLNEFDPDKKPHFLHFTEFESLSGCRINHLFEDTNGNIWVSTDGNGLSVLSADLKTIKNYTVNDGLPSNVVASVTEDDKGDFWVATSKGVAMLSLQEQQFQPYNETNGLFFTEFRRGSVCKSSRGEVFMGSVSGAVAFNPAHKQAEFYTPGVVLETLTIENDEVAIGEAVNGRILLERNLALVDEITLLNRENTFTLAFTTLDFINPLNNYYYRLDGMDTSWHYLSNANRVTYQKLPAGNYTFRVKGGSLANGTINETCLNITVKQSFYKTPYFIAIIVAFIAAFIWYFYGYFQRKIIALRDSLEDLTSDKEKYTTSKLDEVMIADIRQKLQNYMAQEKPFLNAELKQGDVSVAIGVAVHELSQVLNQELQSTFREYINQFRVEEFILKMAVADISKYTLLAIAEQCGFKSKSSFYRAFKKVTGLTPAEYFNKSDNV